MNTLITYSNKNFSRIKFKNDKLNFLSITKFELKHDLNIWIFFLNIIVVTSFMILKQYAFLEKILRAHRDMMIEKIAKYSRKDLHKATQCYEKDIWWAKKAVIGEFKRFKQAQAKYPSASSVWKRNFLHIEQLFNYESAVRKIIYTIITIENVNSSLRKVTKMPCSSCYFYVVL
jgi:hypothetical protein